MAVTNYATFSISLGNKNSSYSMSKLKISIGRSNSNDIVILDATVDPTHAIIEKRGESQFYLKNLSTPSKTKVNNSNVTNETLLRHGSIIFIGRSTLIFSFGEVDVKTNKIFNGIEGNFPIIDSVGGLLDSGYNGFSFAPYSHAHNNIYYTKSEIDYFLENIESNISLPLPISDVDGLQQALDGKASLSLVNSHINNYNNPHHVTASQLSVYTKTEIDNLLSNISVDMSNYYTKTEVDDLLSNVSVDLSNYYTKTETSNLITSSLSNYYTKTAINSLFNNYYTKTSIDLLLVNKLDIFTGNVGNIVNFNSLGYPHDSGYGIMALPIGNAEDGSYTDGLFTDLTPNTPVGVFADRVNEILQSLSPSPAPSLSAIGFAQSGASGKLSFDSVYPISTYTPVNGINNLTSVSVDTAFTNGALSSCRHGIFSASTTSFSGTLASNVPQGSGSPTASYPANSFGDADTGILKLYINNISTPTVSVDLSTFSSGSTLNGNGSGLVLSAANPVNFPISGTLNLFKYRTGTWIVSSNDLNAGWNYITVVHTINGTDRTVSFHDLVRDLDTTPTAFSSESLTGWSGTGTKYLSGVKYYTGGSASYAITISNAYKNTYIDPNAISYSNNSTPLQIISSDSLPNSNGNENATYSPSKTVNVTTSGVRLLNQPITVKTTALRTVQSSQTSTGSSVNNILLDNVTASSTVLSEPLDDENYRIPSNADFESYLTGVTNSWTSSNSIENAGSTGYNDGLQVYGGQLVYPSINFSTIANGPSGNVNYSSCSGNRIYYRFFYKTPAANFTLTVSGTATPRSSSYTMTNGTNDIKIDIKIPNSGGEGTGWMDVTQLFATGQWTDGSGCLLSGTFSMNSAKSLTIGTKNTGSLSVNGIIFLRIRVPQGWTGSLNSITMA